MTINSVESLVKSTVTTETLEPEKSKVRRRLSKVFDECFTTESKYYTIHSSDPLHTQISDSNITSPVQKALFKEFQKASPAKDTIDLTDISKNSPVEFYKLIGTHSKISTTATTSTDTNATSASPAESDSKVKAIVKEAFDFMHELVNDQASPRLIAIAEANNLPPSQLTATYLTISNDLHDVELEAFQRLIKHFLILDSAINYSKSPYKINSINSSMPFSSFSIENVESLGNLISDMINIDPHLTNQFLEFCLPSYASSYISASDVRNVITQIRSDVRYQSIENSLLTKIFFHQLTHKKRKAIARSFLEKNSVKKVMRVLRNFDLMSIFPINKNTPTL